MDLKKSYIAIGIIIILILAILFAPKFLSKGDKKVKYKVLESSEIPEKIKEILPKYLTDERALTCRLNDEIYVLVTRGEKQTGGYTVNVDKIIMEQKTKDDFDLTVYAKFKDPDPNDIVAQGFSYPFAIVKTNLNRMPESIKLEVEYEE
ncbi:protease complex subunit PrcB family protein [Schnuerera ultunensis]|uniref:protease complex subunit PrcB family protein n=1 Tax=Schnuerera ultunensis TaxID=45497 RepID=UPI000D6E149E